MSHPENPLARYRSSSYHHLLIACENSAVAEALSKSTDFHNFFLHDRTTEGNRVRMLENQGKYIVIINGMVDADFSIASLSWETFTAANAVQGDRYTSMAVEGNMAIREPRGFRFMSVLKNACNELQKDMIGVVWMVKTIFVGHGHSQFIGDFTEMMTNIKPLLFYIEDIVGSFDETGSNYEIKFVGNNDGVTRLPQMMRVADGLTVQLGGQTNNKDISLSGAMLALEKKVNEVYERYYNCVTSSYRRALNQETQTQSQDPPFQKVLYLLELEPPYDDKSKYKVTDGPQQIKDGIGKCDDPLILKLGQSATVEEGMREIMARCIQVKKDAEGPGQKWTYKITSTIKSGPDARLIIQNVNRTDLIGSDTKDVYDYVIVFKVQRFPIITNDLVKNILDGKAETGEVSKEDINNNLLVLDYIYTGKNIDIISFDMKMQAGLAFLQVITTSDNLLGQRAGLPSRYNILANTDNRLGIDTIKTPLFMGVPIKDPLLRNSQDPIATMSFVSALAAHATLEVAEAAVTIYGNPYLLGALGSTDFQQQEQEARKLVEGTSENPDRDVFSNWGSIPALAKVNIRMPRSNDDLKLMEQGGGDYSEPFWYQDYFYVYGIKHMFNDGLFTQELSMVALPNQSRLDQYLKQGTDKSKGILCNEYIFGSEHVSSGVTSKVNSGGQKYTYTQMKVMTTSLLAAAQNVPPKDGATIQIVRAIALQESAAGDFFLPSKQKIGDTNLSNSSYGITQFQLATARSVLKTDNRTLTYFNKIKKTNYSDATQIPDNELIDALYEDSFALAMTISHVDSLRRTKFGKDTGTTRYQFPEYVFRNYNSSKPDLDYPNTHGYARNALQHYLNIQWNQQTTADGKPVTPLNQNIFGVGDLQDPQYTTVNGQQTLTHTLIAQRIAQLDGRPVVPGKVTSSFAPSSKPKVEDVIAGDMIETSEFDYEFSTSQRISNDDVDDSSRQKQKVENDKKKKDCGSV